MDLLQKSRIRWGIEGDENTKYFHYMIKKHRRRLAVSAVLVDGVWLSAPDKVKDAFFDFFSDTSSNRFKGVM